jgi:pimeloyl-ACP methyl ester carboxylesterase
LTGITVSAGADLYIRRGGSGSPTLVLLHGLGANGEVWNRTLPIVRKRWHGTWIVPDLRGHGRSGHRAPYSYGAYASDIASLLPQDEDVTVIGHSMGGVVALALATGWYGVKVQRVAAFGVKIRWTAEEEDRLRQLARAPVRWFDTQAEAIERYLKISGLIGLVDAAGAEAASGVVEVNGRFRLASDPVINAAIGPRVAELAAAVRAPFRLAAGSKDPMVSAADMMPFDASPTIFAGAGHNAHVEKPEEVWDFAIRGT